MRALLLLLISLWLGLAVAGDARPLAADPQTEQRMLAISSELRCLVCQNETLAASHASLAEDLRRELRTLIQQGKTDSEIIDYLVARYGDFIRYRPPVKPTTWLLWFGPLLGLLAALAGLLQHLRRRSIDSATADFSPEDSLRAQALLHQAEHNE